MLGSKEGLNVKYRFIKGYKVIFFFFSFNIVMDFVLVYFVVGDKFIKYVFDGESVKFNVYFQNYFFLVIWKIIDKMNLKKFNVIFCLFCGDIIVFV